MIPRRYVLAVGLAALATAASLLLAPRWQPLHLLLPFYPAVMVSAWLGGFGPGLTTTVVSALIINYFWLPPNFSFGISETGDWIGFILFLGVGLLISSLSQRLLSAQRRAEATAAELQHEIDERRRAEEAAAKLTKVADELRSAAERYRVQFERNLAGVFRVRRDGRLLECSDTLTRLLGYGSSAEVLDRSMKELFASPADWAALVASLAPGVVVSNHEMRLRRRDGTPLTVLVTVREAEDGALEGLAIDITDRKRAEEAEHQAARLRAVADLAAAAAHEINNPLTIILTDLSQLKKTELAARIERTLEAARRIQDIVERMAHIERVETVDPASPHLPPMLDIRKSSAWNHRT